MGVGEIAEFTLLNSVKTYDDVDESYTENMSYYSRGNNNFKNYFLPTNN